MHRFLCFMAIALGLALASDLASAQASLRSGFGGPLGYGTAVVPSGTSTFASLALDTAFPGGVMFLSGTATHTSLFANTKGTLTFGDSGSGLLYPMTFSPTIAPFWGDVDTRGSAPPDENRVYYHSEAGLIVVTYYRVGYYDAHRDLESTFQVILSSPVPSGSFGEVDIEYRYQSVGWLLSDMSSQPPFVGFATYETSIQLPVSLTPGVADLPTLTNTGEPGVFRFFVREFGLLHYCGDGTPDPGEGCDDGNLFPGDGCNAACRMEAAVGETCVNDTDCRSMACADGICCGTPCGDCGDCSTGSCVVSPSGDICRPSSGDFVCDAEEQCDGFTPSCPPDDLEFTDGNVCGDICARGQCRSGTCQADPNPCTGCPPGFFGVCSPEGDHPRCDCYPNRDGGLPFEGGMPPFDGSVFFDGGPPAGIPAGSGLSCAITRDRRAPLWPVGGLLLCLAWLGRRGRTARRTDDRG